MLSRRSFITMSLIMAAALFLFVTLNTARERINNYQYNENALADMDMPNSSDVWDETSASPFPHRTVIYLGDPNHDSYGSTVKEWCVCSKQKLIVSGGLEKALSHSENAEVLVINPDFLRAGDSQRLAAASESGLNMIFCSLPKPEVIAGDSVLSNLLGIQKVRESVCVLDGVRLFRGFLLGGDGFYIAQTDKDKKNQDLDLTLPWYTMDTGTKVYMAGFIDDKTLKNEEMPPVIWRASPDSAKVFAVNGSFIADKSGIGFLSAMMYELHDTEVYPIVNAQLFTAANCPDITSENAAEINKIYNRDLEKTLRDIIMPGIARISGETGYPINCMAQLKAMNEDPALPNPDMLVYYIKWLKGYRSEMGLSMSKRTPQPIALTAGEFDGFFSDNGLKYRFNALYTQPYQLPELESMLAGGSPGVIGNISTVVCDELPEQKLIGFISENVTLQSVPHNAFKHTYSDNIRLRAVETALGYSNIMADMTEISFPPENSEHWEKLVKKMASNIDTYWSPFNKFDRIVVSESDRRIRNFLAADYCFQRSGSKVSIQCDREKSWFLLRTHGEVPCDVKGGSALRLEKDSYLISLTEKKAEVTLKNEGQTFTMR